MKSQEYWTLYRYGEATVVCSKHRTPRAARHAADTCEYRGGAKHQIVGVYEVPRRLIGERKNRA